MRRFIATEVAMLLRDPRFVDAIFAFLRADMPSQARADTVVLPRLRAIAGD